MKAEGDDTSKQIERNVNFFFEMTNMIWIDGSMIDCASSHAVGGNSFASFLSFLIAQIRR